MAGDEAFMCTFSLCEFVDLLDDFGLLCAMYRSDSGPFKLNARNIKISSARAQLPADNRGEQSYGAVFEM